MTPILSARAPESAGRAAGVLRSGQIVAIPTETVYGLAVLPRQDGLERLLVAKRRSTEKGIQLLVDSLDQAQSVAVLHDVATRLADAFWPGGLTLVLDRRPGIDLPDLLGGGRPTLGIRLPDHDVPRELARLLGPIAASSANGTGEPDATTAQRVAETLGREVELIIDDGPVRGGTPSTVVDCSSAVGGVPRILREGAISAAAIAAALA